MADIIQRERGVWSAGRTRLGSWGRWSARSFRSHPMGGISAVILLAIVLLAIVGPSFTPFRFDRTVTSQLREPLSVTKDGHRMLLGSDEIGRDVFTRLLYGGRVSLLVGVLAPLLGVSIGTILGIVSAFFGGKVDILLQRLVDTLLVLPGLVIALAVTVAFGFTVPVVIFALAIGNLGGTVRVVRSRVLSLKEMQYIEASRAIGATSWRTIFRHLAPNSFVVAIVLFTVGVGSSITAEAALSFLGIGILPPTPSWGNLLTNAQQFFNLAPQLAIAPGVLITVVVLSVNLFGDALRDILDPRLRGRT